MKVNEVERIETMWDERKRCGTKGNDVGTKGIEVETKGNEVGEVRRIETKWGEWN